VVVDNLLHVPHHETINTRLAFFFKWVHSQVVITEQLDVVSHVIFVDLALLDHLQDDDHLVGILIHRRDLKKDVAVRELSDDTCLRCDHNDIVLALVEVGSDDHVGKRVVHLARRGGEVFLVGRERSVVHLEEHGRAKR